MKVNQLFIFILLFIWACEAEVPIDSPVQEPRDPFEVEGFLSARRLSNYVISERLIYLGIEDRDLGNSIQVFDTESENLTQTIRLTPSYFKFLGKHQNHLYSFGKISFSNGEERATIIQMDLQGQKFAEFSSDNSCLPEGYRFSHEDGQLVDEAGNIWLYLWNSVNATAGPHLGLLRFQPASNTCTYWDENNSNIPGNIIRDFKPYQDKLYLSSRYAHDSLYNLSRFDQGTFTTIGKADFDFPIIKGIQTDVNGLLYYVETDLYTQQMRRADGSLIDPGLDEDYTQENLSYWKDNEQNEFVFGTASVQLRYSNYDPYPHFFPYFSKNGETLVDWLSEFQPFKDVITGDMYQFPGETDEIWLVGPNPVDGVVIKLRFNE
ncbi:MAG: hypothetical protein AAGD28_31905 [Bacteroidota bacterium]